MSDDSNVTPLRPGRGRGRGGGEPPGLPPLPGAPPGRPEPPAGPPATTTSAPPPDEGSGAELVPARRRRSAAESVAALTATPPAQPPARREAQNVPATFRSEGIDSGDDARRPGLGALSLSAILAVALAPLRGPAGAIQDWRQRRLERAREAEPLRKAKLRLQEARLATDTAMAGGSGGKGGRVPSSHDWGRKAHGGGGGSPGGGGKHGKSGGPHGRSGSGASPSHTSKSASPSSGRSGPHGSHGASSPSGGSGKHGKDSPAGHGKAGKGSPGTLGQLALDRSQRRTARQAAEDKRAARQQKADLADRKKADGKAGKDGSAGGTKNGEKAAKEGGKTDDSGGDERVTFGRAVRGEWARRAWKRWEARQPDPPFLRRDRKDAEDGEDADGAGAEKETGKTADDAEADAASKGPDGAGGGAGWEWVPPPRGERRSAADGVAEETVITVERADRPGDAERRHEPEPVVPAAITTGVRGLPRAPYRPAGPRPGTTRPGRYARVPSMTKEAPVSASGSVPSVRMPGGGISPAPEHMTEVTLDDVLDHLTSAKLNCFVTYDECARLAGKAREIRRHLDDLAHDLAQYHNVIGRLTSAAMARLAESMDVLARKAEEMRTESLKAAEAVETAHDEMHDAYKPVQKAAADAGLSTPSARIHNED